MPRPEASFGELMQPEAYAFDPRLTDEALAQLDARDRAHLANYGHVPGADPTCTLPSRASVQIQALAAARAGHVGVTLSGATRDVVAEMNSRDPFWHVTMGEDPAVGAGRDRGIVQEHWL